MTRKLRDKYQQRFDLYADDPAEQRLREYLAALAEKGKQRDWIVLALIAALPPTSRSGEYQAKKKDDA